MGLSTRNQVPITAQRLLEVEVPALKDQLNISQFVGALGFKLNAELSGPHCRLMEKRAAFPYRLDEVIRQWHRRHHNVSERR